jgi:hypothetical protein
MPSRNLPFSTLNDTSELTPRGFSNPKVNCFDKAFNAALTESWDDWIQWGSNTLEPDSPVGDRRESLASNVSLIDTCADGAGENLMSRSYSADNHYLFDDSPFELESPAQSSSSSAVDFMSAPLPTYLWREQDQPSTLRRFSSLTPEEEKRLKDIAMPYRMQSLIQTPTEHGSPLAPSPPKLSSATATIETRIRKSRKKKQSPPQETMANTLRQSRQKGHNAIEKRYRTNLNEKIDCLRQGIPSLSRTSSSGSNSGDEDLGETRWDGQQKYGKAAILTRALDYIKHLENTTQRLGGEVESLKGRTGSLDMDVSMNGCVTAHELLLPKTDTLESIQAGMVFSCSVLSK